MSNPFLFLTDTPTPSSNPYTTSSAKAASTDNHSISTMNMYRDILETVLLCTIDEQPSTSLIYLAELAGEVHESFDKNFIDQALFERLHMTDPSSQLLTATTKKSTIKMDMNVITENRCLQYLAGCYQRLIRQRVSFFFYRLMIFTLIKIIISILGSV